MDSIYILTNPYYFTIPLIIGFILDSILGDPQWLPHPVRIFGRMIFFSEKKMNTGNYRIIKGIIQTMILVSISFMVLFFIEKVLLNNVYVFYTYTSIMVFYGIANKNLITEALKVEKKISTQGLIAARKQLSQIVGRDTSTLSENQIRIAVLETLSENLSDGIIAPLFYYALGGIPLMFTYKMVNTLDSIIGYKNERYKKFGFFTAKLDDIANYIPSRVTALLMVFITFSKRGVVYIIKFGNKHSSPNAGYPEAALSGILNCRFGGVNIYSGKVVEKPFIGFNERTVLKKDIEKACLINIMTSILFIIILVFINIGISKLLH